MLTVDQLTDAVRRHAKTVLLPSVAEAIVRELNSPEKPPRPSEEADDSDHQS